MSTQFIAALWICFVLCTMVCLVTEKAYLDTDPTNTNIALLDMINAPTYNMSSGIAPLAFPALVLKFFTGLWRILTWDYSFWKLNPVLEIVRIVFCYPITLIAIWGLIQMFIGTVTNLLG
jgi:hypothetical protein